MERGTSLRRVTGSDFCVGRVRVRTDSRYTFGFARCACLGSVPAWIRLDFRGRHDDQAQGVAWGGPRTSCGSAIALEQVRLGAVKRYRETGPHAVNRSGEMGDAEINHLEEPSGCG